MNKVFFSPGFVSLQVSYYSGLKATEGPNIHSMVFTAVTLIAGLMMLSVYCFNKIYLKNKVVHIVESTTAKNIVGFKTLIGSVFTLFGSILSFLFVQKALGGSGQVGLPYGPFLGALLFTVMNFYFAMKKYVRDYTALQIQKKWETFKFYF